MKVVLLPLLIWMLTFGPLLWVVRDLRGRWLYGVPIGWLAWVMIEYLARYYVSLYELFPITYVPGMMGVLVFLLFGLLGIGTCFPRTQNEWGMNLHRVIAYITGGSLFLAISPWIYWNWWASLPPFGAFLLWEIIFLI